MRNKKMLNEHEHVWCGINAALSGVSILSLSKIDIDYIFNTNSLFVISMYSLILEISFVNTIMILNNVTKRTNKHE